MTFLLSLCATSLLHDTCGTLICAAGLLYAMRFCICATIQVDKQHAVELVAVHMMWLEYYYVACGIASSFPFTLSSDMAACTNMFTVLLIWTRKCQYVVCFACTLRSPLHSPCIVVGLHHLCRIFLPCSVWHAVNVTKFDLLTYDILQVCQTWWCGACTSLGSDGDICLFSAHSLWPSASSTSWHALLMNIW